MPITQESALRIIFQALANLNQERNGEDQVPLAVDTPLFGKKSLLDSLALVSMIVDVETAVSDELGEAICLTSDEALNQEKSPFADVGALRDYILHVTAGKG
jgi:acyl carrier protein